MEQLDWLRAVIEGEPLPKAVPKVDAEGRPMLERPGRFADRGLLGSGGMGTVRAAHDLVIRREVAVKLLHAKYSQEPLHLQAFVEEALVTGQLIHPNIVPMYELGRDDRGSTYFTMPRVRGRTLHEILRDPEIPPGSTARLTLTLEVFLKVCDAIGFAHSRRVVHRDLKPANVMVGAFGEVYLMDWGLAKVLRDKEGAVEIPRAPGSPLARLRESSSGTPSYMAPEQVGLHPCADERTDIFGLGAMLYELVTGSPPYTGSYDEVLVKARECAAPPADQGRDFYVPKKLARVIAKAMAKDPDDRYETAAELATQVREFLRRGHHMPVETFAAGQVIVREGAPSDCAYIVTRGECEVTKLVDGERRHLRVMRAGAIFGEGALLDGAPRSATVEATTDVTVMRISREDIDDRLAPDTWEGLLVRTLVERFREHDATVNREAR